MDSIDGTKRCTNILFPKRFLPARLYASAVAALVVCWCVCVCLSVTRRYCIKTAKRKITQTTLRDSPGILVSQANGRW